MTGKLHDIPVTFRMEIETNSKIEELSRGKGTTKSEMIRGFSKPIDPYSTIDNFTPPQSFYYIPGLEFGSK